MSSPAPDELKPNGSVIRWLLDSDPAVRWQMLRDLTDTPDPEFAAERARVATEGWGARLLAMQGTDGRWGGGAWNRGWNFTMHVLGLLRHLGLDAASAEARRARSAGRSPRVTEARLRGQEYLLERRLMRRRSTGEKIERDRACLTGTPHATRADVIAAAGSDFE